MNVVRTGTLSGNNNTVYSDPFAVSERGARALAVMVNRTAGATSATVTLQRAWNASDATADWIDTGITAAYNADAPTRIGTTEDPIWPVYRLKMVTTAAVTVDYRVVAF